MCLSQPADRNRQVTNLKIEGSEFRADEGTSREEPKAEKLVCLVTSQMDRRPIQIGPENGPN